MPERIQLSRRSGFRLPPNAVMVSRPTYWGNPFKVRETVSADSPLWPYVAELIGAGDVPGWRVTSGRFLRTEDVVSAYSAWIIEQPALMVRIDSELAGRDLACWCKLTDVCHADILLALANGWDEAPEPTRAIFAEVPQ